MSMNYTIKIAENDKEGEKLMKQIKELVGESPYVSIYEEEAGLSDNRCKNWRVDINMWLKILSTGKVGNL
jgi:hypothetical protein